MSDVVALVAAAQAKHRRDARVSIVNSNEYFRCRCGESPLTLADHETHVAAAVVEALHPAITTVEQLDALPVGAVIGIGNGCGLYEKDKLGDWGFPPDQPAYLLDEAFACGEQVRLIYAPPGWVGVQPQQGNQQ